jgi:hypothetical protein
LKVAIVGSRGLKVNNLKQYLPKDVTEIVSGGVSEISISAAGYAKKFRLKLTRFLPKYDIYGKQAHMMRNISIIQYSDLVIAFWDGQSKGIGFVIETCNAIGKHIKVIMDKVQ